MMKHQVAATLACSVFLLASPAVADTSMPISASQPPTLSMNANVATVQSVAGEPGYSLRPEMLGAAAIGIYALLRSRSRRIV